MAVCFDRTAWFYDALARLVFGKSIRQSQVALLPYIPAGATILLLGGGTGWLLQDLACLNIPLQVLYLELSSKMLARARQQLVQLPAHPLQISFREGNENSLLPEEYFDVIITPFVLDLYPPHELWPMGGRLQQHLKPGGRWLLADFFIDRTQPAWQQWWQHGLTWLMYTFFRWMCRLETRTLPNLDLLLTALPLKLVHTQYFFHGFIRSQVYQKI